MLTKESKEAHIKVYARNNPNQSASQIYKHFKGSQYSVRKTDCLRFVREERGKSISSKKQMASIPVKYRKDKVKVKAPTGYAYAVKELPKYRDTKDLNKILSRLEDHPNSYAVASVKVHGTEYHVKFKQKGELNRQMSILKEHYQFEKDDANISYNGPHAKRGDRFATFEFIDKARSRGIVFD